VKRPTPNFDPVREGLSELGEYIRAQREVTNLSVRRLAQAAGVSNPYLSQIERGLRRPSADILQQIAKALRISAENLYVRAGILDPSSAPSASVTDAIASDPNLTPDQKHALLTVYRGFLGERAEAEPMSTDLDEGVETPS
jgi:transcriptional regulator with XRE-family HTH domain